MRFFAFLLCLAGVSVLGFAQTKHPLLLDMQEKARALEYGSYAIEAFEKYPYSKDSIVYKGHCAFSRFEQLNGKPGLRYDVEMETRYPQQTFQQRQVFDGVVKFDLRNDTLALLYDSREHDDEYLYRGLQHFFFIPLLLHPERTKKYFGPDKSLGTPPYETLGDTLIEGMRCTLVGADYASDSAQQKLQHIRFALHQHSGLPVYFCHIQTTVPEYEKAPVQTYRLEIRVREWSPALPLNNFYIDWLGLPPSFEVRQFHDCYHRDLLRPRNPADL